MEGFHVDAFEIIKEWVAVAIQKGFHVHRNCLYLIFGRRHSEYTHRASVSGGEGIVTVQGFGGLEEGEQLAEEYLDLIQTAVQEESMFAWTEASGSLHHSRMRVSVYLQSTTPLSQATDFSVVFNLEWAGDILSLVLASIPNLFW